MHTMQTNQSIYANAMALSSHLIHIAVKHICAGIRMGLRSLMSQQLSHSHATSGITHLHLCIQDRLQAHWPISSRRSESASSAHIHNSPYLPDTRTYAHLYYSYIAHPKFHSVHCISSCAAYRILFSGAFNISAQCYYVSTHVQACTSPFAC